MTFVPLIVANCIFQSTLPREERQRQKSIKKFFQNFNPRSHERSDVQLVSGLHFHLYFNPRSHERSDRTKDDEYVIRKKFQSTLPREERRYNLGFSEMEWDFNPRSHERSDRDIRPLFPDMVYFNPRSHERSDCDVVVPFVIYAISIHAPTRGATVISWIWVIGSKRFQSTLPREERPSSSSSKSIRMLFQSTLPREERRLFHGYG